MSTGVSCTLEQDSQKVEGHASLPLALGSASCGTNWFLSSAFVIIIFDLSKQPANKVSLKSSNSNSNI